MGVTCALGQSHVPLDCVPHICSSQVAPGGLGKRASLSQSLVGSLLLSPGSWCTRGVVCALQESVSPVLCKFWWLCGVVNGDLLQDAKMQEEKGTTEDAMAGLHHRLDGHDFEVRPRLV